MKTSKEFESIKSELFDKIETDKQKNIYGGTKTPDTHHWTRSGWRGKLSLDPNA